MKRLDLAGKRFGRLTVIAFRGMDHHGKSRWLCRCSCGVKKTLTGSMIRRRVVRSCGCLRAEQSPINGRNSPGRLKHGHARDHSPEYAIWKTMNQRCSNPKSQDYEAYGGRGIRVCDAWREDFTIFLRDMGNRLRNRPTLDRRDNDGDYTPENCRWTTWKQQANNRRPRKTKEE